MIYWYHRCCKYQRNR